MGSQNSKELIFRDNSLLSLEENSIDYNGINIFEDGLEEIQNNFDENFDENSNTTFEKKSVDINLKAESNKIPITFEYEYEGNTVYLSGNFCNWNQYFLMQNNQNGKHTLILYLNKGLIQYKFKVNNEWKYNENIQLLMIMVIKIISLIQQIGKFSLKDQMIPQIQTQNHHLDKVLINLLFQISNFKIVKKNIVIIFLKKWK